MAEGAEAEGVALQAERVEPVAVVERGGGGSASGRVGRRVGALEGGEGAAAVFAVSLSHNRRVFFATEEAPTDRTAGEGEQPSRRSTIKTEFGLLGWAGLDWAGLRCAALRCAVPCCAVLCRAVLCCAVLCCAVPCAA